MRRQSARLTAVLAATLLLGACSDGPVSPRADGDPLVEAVNRHLVDGGMLILVDSHYQGTLTARPSLAGIAEEARARGGSMGPQPGVTTSGLTSVPFYCFSPSDSHWCPQFNIGTAVWGWGVPGKATLYAHLDAMDNIETAELSVSLGFKGGCGGTPGTFASRHLWGGSNTPYALVVNEVHEFTGGAGQWRVQASATLQAPWGTMGDGWSSATACH
jgi:hypothetical protein